MPSCTSSIGLWSTTFGFICLLRSLRLSYCEPTLQSIWSGTVSLIYWGAIPGALPIATIADRLGRKQGLFATFSASIVALLLAIYSLWVSKLTSTFASAILFYFMRCPESSWDFFSPLDWAWQRFFSMRLGNERKDSSLISVPNTAVGSCPFFPAWQFRWGPSSERCSACHKSTGHP